MISKPVDSQKNIEWRKMHTHCSPCGKHFSKCITPHRATILSSTLHCCYCLNLWKIVFAQRRFEGSVRFNGWSLGTQPTNIHSIQTFKAARKKHVCSQKRFYSVFFIIFDLLVGPINDPSSGTAEIQG